MNKKVLTFTKTLGPSSAKIVNELMAQGKDIFTLNDVCEITQKDKQEISDFLRNLVNRGVLTRLRSGVFLILKTGQEDTQLSNWPIIARTLAGTNPYYISHYSAMRLHGMTTHPLTTVTITMTKKHIIKKIHNISYQFIYTKPDNFWGFCVHWVTRQERVSVSDIERTILDCLERPELCGGVKEVVRGIWSKQQQIDWNKLIAYAKKYRTKAAVKRLGFILEMLNLGQAYHHFLEESILTRKDYVLLEPNEPRSGKYISRWRIQVNMNIEELKAGIWG